MPFNSSNNIHLFVKSNDNKNNGPLLYVTKKQTHPATSIDWLPMNQQSKLWAYLARYHTLDLSDRKPD